MTNENLSSPTPDNKRIPFGARLKAAREAMGLERSDVANQLRLNEKVIVMMEKDRYPIDLPVTFIRGYLRSYAKFLQIPEYEIKKGIEPIKPKPTYNEVIPPTKAASPVTSGNYFMQFFTYLIVFTLVALVGMWWYTHSRALLPTMAENQNLSSVTNQQSPLPDAIPNKPTNAQLADASSPDSSADSELAASDSTESNSTKEEDASKVVSNNDEAAYDSTIQQVETPTSAAASTPPVDKTKKTATNSKSKASDNPPASNIVPVAPTLGQNAKRTPTPPEVANDENE